MCSPVHSSLSTIDIQLPSGAFFNLLLFPLQLWGGWEKILRHLKILPYEVAELTYIPCRRYFDQYPRFRSGYRQPKTLGHLLTLRGRTGGRRDGDQTATDDGSPTLHLFPFLCNRGEREFDFESNRSIGFFFATFLCLLDWQTGTQIAGFSLGP